MYVDVVGRVAIVVLRALFFWVGSGSERKWGTCAYITKGSDIHPSRSRLACSLAHLAPVVADGEAVQVPALVERRARDGLRAATRVDAGVDGWMIMMVWVKIGR